MSSDFTNITVLGSGVLGSQIAYQTAFSGFAVAVYDISDDALAAARKRFDNLAATYIAEDVAGADADSTKTALDRLTLTTDLSQAVADADLVIEAVPEVLTLKQEVYEQIGKVAPERTVFATNSSTLLPSDIKDFTGRPDKFLALHFANRVWAHNTAEIMGTPDTDPAIVDQVTAFAEKIKMVPIVLHKEVAGYVLNSLLVPWLGAAAGLAAFDVADPKDIDNVWRIATGAPIGPFQIFDIIGLNTPYNIMVHGDEQANQIAAWLKATYIDKGKLGLESGEGFYTYEK